MARNDLCIASALFGSVRKVPARAYFKRRPRLPAGGGGRDGDAGGRRSHLELGVLLLEVLVFVRVAVWELVDLDAVLLDLLTDLRAKRRERNTAVWASVIFLFFFEWLRQRADASGELALIFFFFTSLGVSVSAFARTGTMFTFSCRAFMNSTSKGRSL